ncbi:MAG: PfkB family carbohydrate kinase, partial [Spirochaetota bacterium]
TGIVEPSPAVSPVESASLRNAVLELIRGASLLCICGTAVGHEPDNAYYDIVREARMLNVPVILDAHKEHGTRALGAAPDVLKINEQELTEIHSALQGSPRPDETTRQDRERMARDLIATCGINIVIVTRGKFGAEAYDSHGWASAVSSITNIVNPIGCGDAFTAALAQKMTQDRPAVDTAPPLASLIRHGVTVATAHGLSMMPGHLDTANISRVARTILVSGSERTMH